MTEDPIIGHLHRKVAEVERHSLHLSHQLEQHRQAVAALRAGVRHQEFITPAFVTATLDGYGL